MLNQRSHNSIAKVMSAVFLTAGIGIAPVNAADYLAMPGDQLYNWKLTSEDVWRMTSSDQLGVDITLSNRRVSELVVVSGDQGRQQRALDNYEKLLIKFTEAQSEKDRARILPVLKAQHQALIDAGITIPVELEALFPK